MEGLYCNCEKCDLKSTFLGYLPNDEVLRICSSKKETVYKAGDIIIKEGDRIDEFIYLKSGLVKLYRTTSMGKEQIITLCRPYDYISLLSIFSNTEYHYSVKALQDSEVCMIDLDQINQRAHKNGIFAINLMQKLSKISDSILIHTLEINQRNLRGRIAFILLFMSSHLFEDAMDFELPVSRREIADMIGMTSENVIRIMSEFRKDGILKINGKNIEIADPQRLINISLHG